MKPKHSHRLRHIVIALPRPEACDMEFDYRYQTSTVWSEVFWAFRALWDVRIIETRRLTRR